MEASLAPAWSLARPDWRTRILAGQSLLPDLPLLDQAAAAKAISVYDRLRIPDVTGQPTFGEAGGDWFREIVGAVHGALIGGKREIEGFFALVPKKNSKTTNGAGLMMTALLLNRRPRADFLLLGVTQQISDTAFEQADGMVGADAGLKKRLHVQAHRKTITNLATGATLRVKSFSMKIVTGKKPVGVLIDELHLLGHVADAARVIGQLRGGLISQPEGFLGFITTQSDVPPAGVFASELRKARAIRDGIEDGRMLSILYEFPEDIQAPVPAGEIPKWQDPKIWPLVTPNLDRSVTLARLQSDFAEAQRSGLVEVIRWSSQHLNIEIGLALRSDRWEGAEYWEQCGDKAITLDALIERSEVAVVGIDGGGLDDLLGLCVLGREKVTGRWIHWAHAWAHRDVLERRKSEAPKLRDFAADGDLTICAEARNGGFQPFPCH